MVGRGRVRRGQNGLPFDGNWRRLEALGRLGIEQGI